MAEFNEVYQRAYYYDIAFRRDVTQEVAFLQQACAELLGRPMESCLEIACGPGYHTRQLAAAGVTAWGLDLRPEMTEFARELADQDGVVCHWIAADMRGFSLPQPVDCIATLYDSLDCLLTHDDLIDHFRTVAANLVPGGMYLFEMTHPRDCSPWEYGSFVYEGERDGVRVRIQWAVNNPVMDPLTQVAQIETVLTVEENGQVQTFHDTASERFMMAQEWLAVIRLAGGLDVVSVLGDFRADQPFDHTEASRRMIFVLRRQG